MKMILTPILLAALTLFSCSGNEQTDNTPVVPADPTNLTAALVSDTSARLTWEHSGEGAEGWWVFMRKGTESISSQPLNAANPLPASERTYLFENLVQGETYSFGVKAKGATASSGIVYADALTVPSNEPGPEPKPETVPVTLTADETGLTAEFRSKSAEGEDILITLAPVSNNKTVQIDRYEIGSEKFRSYTDWLGPYNMKTVAQTTQTEKLSGFVGGWHASNGDGTGDPTAQTQSIEISLDGESFPSGTATGSEATVIVHNKVEALNTKLGESKRFVLNEDVTYTFKESRLYVKVEITAIESVRIAIYYGMQIAGGFCNSFTFTTDDGKTSTTTGNFNCPGKVRDITGLSAGGHTVTAHMFDEGLGTFSKATPAYSALAQYYGANNGKAYYMLIGDMNGSSSALVLKKDATVYWTGYYEFK